MTSMAIAIAVLLACSAFFSASETAFTSANKIRLQRQEENGDKKARLSLMLLERYDNLLSAILIGNNIVNVAAATLATVFFVSLFGDIGISISTAVVTILTLIFGEISPKTIAKQTPERIAKTFARPLYLISLILRPFSFIFQKWQNLIMRLATKGQDPDVITEEELLSIVDVVESGGNIMPHEGELIRSAIVFDDLKAREIYTPRVQLTAVELGTSVEEVSQIFRESGYSRLPVYEDTIDHIVGILHLKDFYDGYFSARERDLNSLQMEDWMSEAIFVSLNIKISRLMSILKKHRGHMAVITDEYGGTVGIITLEDILEELVGDIWDEHDEVASELVKVAPQTYVVSGVAEVDDVLKALHLENIADTIDATTVGGWVINELDRIPVRGEGFRFHHLQVTVDEATRTHVEKVRIQVSLPEKR